MCAPWPATGGRSLDVTTLLPPTEQVQGGHGALPSALLAPMHWRYAADGAPLTYLVVVGRQHLIETHRPGSLHIEALCTQQGGSAQAAQGELLLLVLRLVAQGWFRGQSVVLSDLLAAAHCLSHATPTAAAAAHLWQQSPAGL